jgi:hypothetical protein
VQTAEGGNPVLFSYHVCRLRGSCRPFVSMPQLCPRIQHRHWVHAQVETQYQWYLLRRQDMAHCRIARIAGHQCMLPSHVLSIVFDTALQPISFNITLSRTYRWDTESRDDQAQFLQAIVRLFRTETRGAAPLHLDGVPELADQSGPSALPILACCHDLSCLYRPIRT